MVSPARLFLFLFLVLSQHLFSQHAVTQSYGAHPQQTLDLYLPSTITGSTPVIIMLHGGAWMMGGKEYTAKTSSDLRNRGFVVANVDYRYVSKDVHAKDLLEDINGAITKVQELSGTYGFASSGYHLAGISAGAHLALLTGYTTSKMVRSITALCPPTHFDTSKMRAHLQKTQLLANVELLAGTKVSGSGSQPEAFAKVSPVTYIKNIPTLLFHGDKDDLVPYEQSEYLYEQLRKREVKSKFVTMAGKGHDCGMNQPDSEKEVLDEISNWVTTHNQS